VARDGFKRPEKKKNEDVAATALCTGVAKFNPHFHDPP